MGKKKISSVSGEERGYSIVKRNDLIQHSRYHLSAQEQKIVLYLISKIQPNDDDFKLYKFEIQDFCKVCGIDSTSGGNYILLKDSIKKLSDKSIWVKLDNGKETLLRWIEKPYIDENNGIIEIRLDKDMKPYLLQLKEKFTTYSLYFTLAMKSKYSIRLYELLKSYQNLNQCEFELEHLKSLLAAENYDIFANFKIKVLDIALREINAYGDISASYELGKQGRKFHKIKFFIKPKYDDIDESIRTLKNIEKILSQ